MKWLIIKRFLLKPYIGGVLRFRFSSNKSKINKLHKQAFKHNEIKLPQSFKGLYLIYALSFWFLFLGWKLIWKIWRLKSSDLFKLKKIHPAKQLRDLIHLTFVYTCHPIHYYRLNLYRYNNSEWHKFIFTNELPGWHFMMSPNISLKTKDLLKNKTMFAEHLEKIGLPIIKGFTIGKGNQITGSQLFSEKSLFIKPENGSGQQDNYSLYYDKQTDTYKLIISSEKFLTSEIEILHFVNELLLQKSYLFQALLQNHENIQLLTVVTDLITIRLITIHKLKEFKAISAVLEIPLQNNTKNYCILPIDMLNGKVQLFDENEFTAPLFNTIDFNVLKDYKIPFWDEIVSCALKAHHQMPDVFSVGWDIAITTNGITLIEGNFNWDVTPHQKNGNELIRYFL